MRLTTALLCTLAFATLISCKKETRIRHELSGVWSIQKSEVTYYTAGVADSVVTLEDLGTLELEDYQDVSSDFNHCNLKFVDGYKPNGFLELVNTQAFYKGYCMWYGDLRARDRVTFWDLGGFSGSDEIFVIYSRIENANGPGRKEEWMYLQLNADGTIRLKEVLTVKLTDAGKGPF